MSERTNDRYNEIYSRLTYMAAAELGAADGQGWTNRFKEALSRSRIYNQRLLYKSRVAVGTVI